MWKGKHFSLSDRSSNNLSLWCGNFGKISKEDRKMHNNTRGSINCRYWRINISKIARKMLFEFEGPNYKSMWIWYSISPCPRTHLLAHRMEALRESQAINVILRRDLILIYLLWYNFNKKVQKRKKKTKDSLNLLKLNN